MATPADFKIPAGAPQGKAPIQLYSLATPNGQKVTVALEELGLEYDAHTINISKNTQFEPWFVALNPNSKIPTLVDLNGPGGKPIVIFESGAILIYLAEKTGKLLAKEGSARYSTLQWLMFQMGGVGPMFGQTNHFWSYAPEDVPYGKKRYLTESKRLLSVLEAQLGRNPYSAGSEYTIADIALLPWVDYFFNKHTDKLDGATYPNVERWRQELLARDAVKKGFVVNKLS